MHGYFPGHWNFILQRVAISEFLSGDSLRGPIVASWNTTLLFSLQITMFHVTAEECIWLEPEAGSQQRLAHAFLKARAATSEHVMPFSKTSAG